MQNTTKLYTFHPTYTCFKNTNHSVQNIHLHLNLQASRLQAEIALDGFQDGAVPTLAAHRPITILYLLHQLYAKSNGEGTPCRIELWVRFALYTIQYTNSLTPVTEQRSISKARTLRKI
jgi:hypothetical protein